MPTQSFAISLVAMTTLVLELVLTRVFDVVLGANLGYMVITCALFAFGLAGIYGALRPFPSDRDPGRFLAATTALFGLSLVLLRPVMNRLPFDPDRIVDAPVQQALAFGGLYLWLVVPFFLSGVVFSTLFARYPQRIQSLYLWDLVGAALGCIIPIPLITPIGPGGLLFLAGGLALLASALFVRWSRWSTVTVAASLVLGSIPFLTSGYYDFTERRDTRRLGEAREAGTIEVTVWDPISKIAVVPQERLVATGPQGQIALDRKLVVYDGGTQISYFVPFGGDYQQLRRRVEQNDVETILREFPRQRGGLASHYLKRDSGQKVLVIGSAGGQEIKAALMYGASRVDAIELVRAVVELGRTRYASYIGNLFTHPNVNLHVGEGRSFLRASGERYDIIQIFSNHTSSSIAAGTGAMDPTYLQTAEAYREYFEHLSPNGVLHVNHYAYPRMVTTAALAWSRMGRSDFQRHVAIFERRSVADNTPTFLVKMQPWTAKELAELSWFLGDAGPGEQMVRLVENPLAPGESFLTAPFYSGAFPESLARRIPFRVAAATDDKPYFSLLRKRISMLEPDPGRFVNVSMASLLNSQLKAGILPRDLIHLIVAGACSVVFVVLFIVVPLVWADAGRIRWPGKRLAMVYFSCLGAGFIVLELVFIQIFMKLIGFPLYTYSTVIFTMLFAAGLGSRCSELLQLGVRRGAIWPFVGILVSGLVVLLVHQYLFGVFLASWLPVRVLVAVMVIFPLGFFLGMPFPLGIRSIEDGPGGAVAWAWGLNGAFTVAGGLASVLLSMLLGFRATLLIALGIYLLAAVTFGGLRTTRAGS